MGEALISTGDVERGVEHLANAVIVCGQPTQLLQVRIVKRNNLAPFPLSFINSQSSVHLQVLQQTLPAQVFTLLIQQMRNYGNKVAEQQQGIQHAPAAPQQPQPVTISDLSDELE